MKKPKCYGCDKRHPGCHSECDSYKKFRKELDEYNRKVRASKTNVTDTNWSYIK